jgi:hypothetical protein
MPRWRAETPRVLCWQRPRRRRSIGLRFQQALGLEEIEARYTLRAVDFATCCIEKLDEGAASNPHCLFYQHAFPICQLLQLENALDHG